MAAQVLSLSTLASLVLAAAAAYLTHKALARRWLSWQLIAAATGAGVVWTFFVTLPAAMLLGRKQLPLAAYASLTPLLLGVLFGAALRPFRLSFDDTARAIAFALGWALAGGCFAVAAGAVGAANRKLHECASHMMVIGGALRVYQKKHPGQWPPPSEWVDALVRCGAPPQAFRCPIRPGPRPYNYRRPPKDAPDWFEVISCDHPFMGQTAYLRKDLSHGIRPMGPVRNPQPKSPLPVDVY